MLVWSSVLTSKLTSPISVNPLSVLSSRGPPLSPKQVPMSGAVEKLVQT